jgi:CrcB protein
MHALTGYLAVFFGAGLGGMARHAINRFPAMQAAPLPWATLVVNVTGGLMAGLIAGWLAFRGDAHQTTRLFLVTGFLGGYTTFSAFSLDVVLLVERGRLWSAAGYAASSVLLSIVGVLVGLAVMRT